jgi:DNA-directed RNA polymerase subunit K/omega
MSFTLLLKRESSKEELMELDQTNSIQKAFENRYAAVLKVAKHARKLNMERLHQKTDDENSDAPAVEEKTIKVVSEALKDMLEGKVSFDKT